MALILIETTPPIEHMWYIQNWFIDAYSTTRPLASTFKILFCNISILWNIIYCCCLHCSNNRLPYLFLFSFIQTSYSLCEKTHLLNMDGLLLFLWFFLILLSKLESTEIYYQLIPVIIHHQNYQSLTVTLKGICFKQLLPWNTFSLSIVIIKPKYHLLKTWYYHIVFWKLIIKHEI